MKKLTLSLLVLALVAAFVAPSGLAAAKGKKKKKKKPAGPTVVGIDDSADWGGNVDPTFAPIGAALGQELVEASIEMADAKTVNFIIKVAGLPPTGGIPEFVRYSWDFTVNGDAFGMSGNFTDYARGVCYPAHTDSCPPPRDPGMQPFYVRQGPCTIGTGGLGECNLMATVQATFDAAAGTITIPVPVEAIGAKPGSKIGAGINSVFGGTVFSSPSAVTANANGPHDTMAVDKTFVVPKGK
ncbi:MAG TPA: hypothetical protein VFS18_03420 [Actinomycetota bacterium]|nr:hypothetical protein [Actinomycetota bacterium]